MYFSFKNYTVDYDEKKHSFSCFYRPDGQTNGKLFISDAEIGICCQYGNPVSVNDYSSIECRTQFGTDHYIMTVTYSGGPAEAPCFELHFKVNSRHLHIETVGLAVIYVKGKLHWGADPENSTFGIRLNAEDYYLRTACGPAYSIHDCALFDRLSDSVLEFQASEKLNILYDWNTDIICSRIPTGPSGVTSAEGPFC